MIKPGNDDPNYKKLAAGHDFTTKIDDEYRERLINELKTYPNLFIICGDEVSASHTIQCKSEVELAKAVISICKRYPPVKKFLIECLNHV